ncbi:MAG: GTP-binding protein [Lachnospiraceae bacterium]
MIQSAVSWMVYWNYPEQFRRGYFVGNEIEIMKKIYNIGILAHVDAGKTTLTERILACGGMIRSAGSVDTGTTQTDYLEVERRRGISVKTACAEVDFGDSLIRIVDTPGHVDFVAEVARALQVLDGAVLVISGVEGVQAHTKTIFRALQKLKIPTLIVVNKIDRVGFDENQVCHQIRQQLSENVVVLQKVSNSGTEQCGVHSINDNDWEDLDSMELMEEAFDVLANLDEEMEMMYLEEKFPSCAQLLDKVKQYSHLAMIYPLVFASGKHEVGVQELIHFMLSYLPSSDCLTTDKLCGVVFQITHDKIMGKAAHIRLFGGSLSSRDEVPILGQERDKWEKITQIRQIQGGKLNDTGNMKAGDIMAVYGLSNCKVGDLICEGSLEKALKDRNGLPEDIEKSQVLPLKLKQRLRENVMGVQPLMMVQVKPSSDDKEMALSEALTQLSQEDPFLHYERNPMTRQMYLQVMGLVQIEILEEMLQTRFGLEVIFSKPTVIYKETPGHKAIGREVYTMPKPCWAIVDLQVEPLPSGSGIVFESVIKEKELPYRYQNHVRQSLMDTLQQGIYGWEVVDAKFTLVGGQHHHIHTHPLDFFVATPVAALRALTASESVLLEPYVRVYLSADEQWMGKVLGQIIGMRGEFDSPVIENGQFVIEAVLPLKNSLDYPITFRSMTSGKGTYTMELDSYRPCEEEVRETLPRRGVDPLDRAKWILACRSAY